jgi:hypothetical protein
MEFKEKNTLDALNTYDPDFLNLAATFKRDFPIEHPIPDQPDLPIQPEKKSDEISQTRKRAVEL